MHGDGSSKKRGGMQIVRVMFIRLGAKGSLSSFWQTFSCRTRCAHTLPHQTDQNQVYNMGSLPATEQSNPCSASSPLLQQKSLLTWQSTLCPYTWKTGTARSKNCSKSCLFLRYNENGILEQAHDTWMLQSQHPNVVWEYMQHCTGAALCLKSYMLTSKSPNSTQYKRSYIIEKCYD